MVKKRPSGEKSSFDLNKMKTDPIIVERTFDVPADKIWTALTDHNELSKWYFQLQNFEPRVGFKFNFLAGPPNDKQYLHLCEIIEVVEGKKISYTWRYDSYPGNSIVTCELLDKGERTIVRLTHQGAHTFEEAGKGFEKSSFEEGWRYFIHSALKAHFEADK